MKKLPTIFERDYSTQPPTLTGKITPGLEHILAEGIPTKKWDGTCCMVRDGVLYRRFDRKLNKSGVRKEAPPEWEPCEEEPDAVTGHWPGWLPVGDGAEDRWHRETFFEMGGTIMPFTNATYELVGPKINGNPHGFLANTMIRHGRQVYQIEDRSFEGVRAILVEDITEGIVFWLDGEPAAKIKRSDFGLPWPVKE